MSESPDKSEFMEAARQDYRDRLAAGEAGVEIMKAYFSEGHAAFYEKYKKVDEG